MELGYWIFQFRLVFIDVAVNECYIRVVNSLWRMTMKKIVKPDFLFDSDAQARKTAIEQALIALDDKAKADGEPPVPISDVMARYRLSCITILASSIFASIFLCLAALYFTTLPAPITYATTLDGKLYEVKPYKVER